MDDNDRFLATLQHDLTVRLETALRELNLQRVKKLGPAPDPTASLPPAEGQGS